MCCSFLEQWRKKLKGDLAKPGSLEKEIVAIGVDMQRVSAWLCRYFSLSFSDVTDSLSC